MRKEIVFGLICLICGVVATYCEIILLPYILFVIAMLIASRFFSAKEKQACGHFRKSQTSVQYSVDHSEDNWDMNKLNKRNTQCVDTGVHLDDYRILGQQLGFGICKATKLKWEHFDWVSLINESSHPIKKTKAYTFIGYRDERKAILLCEKIN